MTSPPPMQTVHVETYAADLANATPYGANRSPAMISCWLLPGVIFFSDPIGPLSRPWDAISTAYSVPSASERQVGHVGQARGVDRGRLARFDSPDVGGARLEREPGELADVVRPVGPSHDRRRHRVGPDGCRRERGDRRELGAAPLRHLHHCVAAGVGEHVPAPLPHEADRVAVDVGAVGVGGHLVRHHVGEQRVVVDAEPPGDERRQQRAERDRTRRGTRRSRRGRRTQRSSCCR